MTLTRSSVWRMNLFTCLGDPVFFAETDDDHADEPTRESMIKPRPGTCWLNSKSKIAWQLVGEPRWLRLGKQNILQLFLDFC